MKKYDISDYLPIKDHLYEFMDLLEDNYNLNLDQSNALLHIIYRNHRYDKSNKFNIEFNNINVYCVTEKCFEKIKKCIEHIYDQYEDYEKTLDKHREKVLKKLKHRNTFYRASYKTDTGYTYDVDMLYFKDNADNIWKIPIDRMSYNSISTLDGDKNIDWEFYASSKYSIYKNDSDVFCKYIFNEPYNCYKIEDNGYYLAHIKTIVKNEVKFIVICVEYKNGKLYKQDENYEYTFEIFEERIISHRKISRYV